MMLYNPKKISLEEAQASGVDVNFELMENGEKRYRLVSSDGSGYCRTEGSGAGAWQNSHYHKSTSEFYLVQSGWIVYAELNESGEGEFRILREGESVLVTPLVHHNIYMSADSVIHTIKYGGGAEDTVDWFASEELDTFIQLHKEDGKYF
ncbi:cupin domain-containing protein [Sutcliffiella horikoshii]|uniref:cupin domain-containing protein n=1 Tax=Sutcliffiella horikoshii TaxID=79883 RepID=UPI00384ADC4D